MKVSVLERLFVTERLRKQVSKSSRVGGFATPLLEEQPVSVEELPILVSNTQGEFVKVAKRSASGHARFAFSEVAVDEEDRILRNLYTSLWTLSVENQWGNRHATLQAAIEKMGTTPKIAIIPMLSLMAMFGTELSESDVNMLTLAQGYVSKLGEVHILVADIAPGTGLVLPHPQFVGYYTRVDDRLGILVKNLRQIALVNHELA